MLCRIQYLYLEGWTKRKLMSLHFTTATFTLPISKSKIAKDETGPILDVRLIK